ncbi:MAG TPA: hypothetical protein VEA18_02190 [Candidatus Kapabacteria bacterium]|nr:hypothetical protein [Candidatus Kapabacteria bacterium]
MIVPKKIMLYLCSWFALVLFTVISYQAIAAKRCFFQSNTLLCGETASLLQRVAIFVLVTSVVGIFFLISRTLWKKMTEENAAPITSYAIIGCILFMAIFVVPFGSSDMSYYFGAGRAIEHGLNLYIDQWVMEKDFVYPVSSSVITGFSYGPIIASAFHGLYRLSGGDIISFMLLWKMIMALALVVCVWLSYVVAKALGGTVSKKSAIVLLLLQPMFVFEWVVNGHFDVLWIISVLGAIFFAHRKQWWAVLPLLAIGIWIKFIPALVTPFFFLWWWQSLTKETWKIQVLHTAIGCLLSLGITLASWLPYWSGPIVFQSIIIQSKWAVISLFAVVYYGLQPLFEMVFQENTHWYLTRTTHALLLILLITCLWPYIKKLFAILFRRLTWNTAQFIQAMFIFLLAYLFIWQKSFLPWYGGWFLPLGFVLYSLTHEIKVMRIISWVSIAPFMYYILWLADWIATGTDAGSEWWFYASMFLFVAVYPLWQVWQWRKEDYT